MVIMPLNISINMDVKVKYVKMTFNHIYIYSDAARMQPL